jgi:lysophospholipase L1-like esterase
MVRAFPVAFAPLHAWLCGLLALLSCGCSTTSRHQFIQGDSLVLPGTDAGMLCFDHLLKGTVVVRSQYDASRTDVVVYQEGRDYRVDYENGSISRTRDSRIPDFSTNMLYGQKNFDDRKFPGYGNHRFFVWVDYETTNARPLIMKTDPGNALAKTATRLRSGGPFKIVGFGDSISNGGEASAEPFWFQHRYVAYLSERFPKASIEFENGSTGGGTSETALAKIEEKVLTRHPDLVLVGYGMNDHNINSTGVKAFEANLRTIVKIIRARTDAEIILFSAMPPNNEWMFSSHSMDQVAAASARVAEETHSAYVDVYGLWCRVLTRKDQPSLLGNNINHPNDFGHWLYFQAFKSLEY